MSTSKKSNKKPQRQPRQQPPKASTGPKAENKHALEYRRLFVSEQALKGVPEFQIAEMVLQTFGYSVSQQTVSNDLKAIREEWKKRSTALITEHISEELAHIDDLQRNYYAMFERSKGKKKKAIGDVKYLQRVEWCVESRRELLGTAAPKRTEIYGPNGGPIKLEDVRQRFLGRIASIVQRRGAGGSLKGNK